MDLFDLDTYFSRIVPLKAVQNVMLRSAMAAVAANQIGQMMANHSPLEDLQHLLPFVGEDGILQHTDWFYKAANYYDRGISYLRIFLQRWLSDTGAEGVAGLYVSNLATQQAASWTIDFAVGYDALWPDGSYAQSTIEVVP